jgi:predicted enzyme related to lactoylglutathione lyase
MNNPHYNKFCWSELSTPDVKAAKEFYGKILGWEFEDHDIEGITYTMIKTQDKEFGGMWQIPNDKKNEIPPHWMGYICVENLEKTLKQAQELGATVKMPITKAGEAGIFAIICDPTGAHIAFWESTSHEHQGCC